MLVPNKADHKANAEALMNYYYDPGGRRAGRLGQLHLPGRGRRRRRWRRSTQSLVDNPLIFPDDGRPRERPRLHGRSTSKTREQYDKDFNRVIGA